MNDNTLRLQLALTEIDEHIMGRIMTLRTDACRALCELGALPPRADVLSQLFLDAYAALRKASMIIEEAAEPAKPAVATPPWKD